MAPYHYIWNTLNSPKIGAVDSLVAHVRQGMEEMGTCFVLFPSRSPHVTLSLWGVRLPPSYQQWFVLGQGWVG